MSMGDALRRLALQTRAREGSPGNPVVGAATPGQNREHLTGSLVYIRELTSIGLLHA